MTDHTLRKSVESSATDLPYRILLHPYRASTPLIVPVRSLDHQSETR